MIGAGQQAANYAAAMQAQNIQSPREIGYLDRINGLNIGLRELNGRIAEFHGRIIPPRPEKSASLPPYPTGLPGTLAEAEDTLRACMTLIGEINAAF